ncbi:MAG: 4'-phosphopantetheinyl transferase superfamily protein [Bacteroidota bacterium]
MHQRALRYRRVRDAYNYVYGRLLLQEGLKALKLSQNIDQIQFEDSGKPFLDSVYFNISHSADLVVCAVSTKGSIGIDIEKEAEVELENFVSWFTLTEWKTIMESTLPRRQFYRYWTRKESIIKALGLKLSDLNQIDFDIEQPRFEKNGQGWFLNELSLDDDYTGAICSEFKLEPPIHLEYFDFKG